MADSALFLRSKCAHWKTTGVTATSLGGHRRENPAYFGNEWKNTSFVYVHMHASGSGMEMRTGEAWKRQHQDGGKTCDGKKESLCPGWQTCTYVTR